MSIYSALCRTSDTQLKALADCKMSMETISYHAGLTDAARGQAHMDWTVEEPPTYCTAIQSSCTSTSNVFRITVCTLPFGTGIDVPDVRATINVGAATSLVDSDQGSGSSRARRASRLLFLSFIRNKSRDGFARHYFENRATIKTSISWIGTTSSLSFEQN